MLVLLDHFVEDSLTQCIRNVVYEVRIVELFTDVVYECCSRTV